MFEDDYIMREIGNMTRFLGKVIFQKDNNLFEIINEQGNISESGFLYHRLKIMIDDKKINEAENLLMDEIEQNPTEENLKVAFQFYIDLQNLNDETLIECNFSRQEILEGLEYINKLSQ